jgi:hypothetical protein
MMSMMKFAGKFSKQAREADAPVVHSVYLKGNRMARNDPNASEIVDLDKETVTHIDHQKKQYYTITFQQMRERILEAEREAAQQPQAKPQPAQPKPDTTNAPQMNFNVAVRQTGARKQFSGVETSESILTLTLQATDQQTGQSGSLAMTNDIWLTPEIPGYDEMREFNVRYAKKLGEVYGAAISSMMTNMRRQMPASAAGSSQGFSEMAKEVSKLKGVPVYTVMRMGSTADGKPLAAASEAPLPADDQSASLPSAGDAAKQGTDDAATSAISSKLGGFGSMLGGFGHKKKNDLPPAAATNTSAPPQPTSMVLMETTTEMGGFSRASIDGSHFLPPAGYQQVPIPNLHPQR